MTAPPRTTWIDILIPALAVLIALAVIFGIPIILWRT